MASTDTRRNPVLSTDVEEEHHPQEPLRLVSNHVQHLGKRDKGKLDAETDKFIRFALDGAANMRRLMSWDVSQTERSQFCRDRLTAPRSR